MTEGEFQKIMEGLDLLKAKMKHLSLGIKCAQRILALPEDGERGVTKDDKLQAIGDVLITAAARANGGDATVSPTTTKLLGILVADVELRILWDKLGLKTVI